MWWGTATLDRVRANSVIEFHPTSLVEAHRRPTIGPMSAKLRRCRPISGRCWWNAAMFDRAWAYFDTTLGADPKLQHRTELDEYQAELQQHRPNSTSCFVRYRPGPEPTLAISGSNLGEALPIASRSGPMSAKMPRPTCINVRPQKDASAHARIVCHAHKQENAQGCERAEAGHRQSRTNKCGHVCTMHEAFASDRRMVATNFGRIRPNRRIVRPT